MSGTLDRVGARLIALPPRQEVENFIAAGFGLGVVELTGSESCFALQVVGVGGVPSAWDVRAEGSLDGANWTTLVNHLTATGNGAMVFTGANRYPTRYVRLNVAALTLGPATSIDVYWRANV